MNHKSEIEDGEDAKTDTETEETDEAGDIQKELAKIGGAVHRI